jgi:hypothetical protein
MLTDSDIEMVTDAQATKRERESGDTPIARKAATGSPAQSEATDCYLTLKPFGASMGKENRPDQAIAVLKGFSKAMTLIGDSIPILPRYGQGRHRGVHCFYGFTKEEAKLAASSISVVTFEFEGVECSYTLGWVHAESFPMPKPEHDFDAQVARQTELKNKDWDAPAPKRPRDDGSTHIVVFAEEGWTFLHVTIKQIKTAFGKLGLNVISSSRPCTKFDD